MTSEACLRKYACRVDARRVQVGRKTNARWRCVMQDHNTVQSDASLHSDGFGFRCRLGPVAVSVVALVSSLLTCAPSLAVMPFAQSTDPQSQSPSDARSRDGQRTNGQEESADRRTADAGPPDADPAAAPRRDRAQRGGRASTVLPPDWPRAGGFGGRERPLFEGLVADEFLNDLARRELTDEELARAIRIATRVSEEWGKTLAARAEQDPIQLKVAMRSTGRRILALMSLEERSPELFEAKIVELRAQGETARAGDALRRAQERASGADADDNSRAPSDGKLDVELTELRAALDAAVARQVVATIAVRREEIRAIESRLARAKDDIERDAAEPSRLVEEIRARALAPRDGRGGVDGGSRDSRDPRDPRGEPRNEAPRNEAPQ